MRNEICFLAKIIFGLGLIIRRGKKSQIMVHRAVQGDCKTEHLLGVHFLSLALKESLLIVIGNGIVGSERSVESPDCLLLYVILKLYFLLKCALGGKKKLLALG